MLYQSPNVFFKDIMNQDDELLDKALEGAVMFAFNSGEARPAAAAPRAAVCFAPAGASEAVLRARRAGVHVPEPHAGAGVDRGRLHR